MKLTKSKLLKLIKEEMKTLEEDKAKADGSMVRAFQKSRKGRGRIHKARSSEAGEFTPGTQSVRGGEEWQDDPDDVKDEIEDEQHIKKELQEAPIGSMKITKSKLKQIIEEEISSLSEAGSYVVDPITNLVHSRGSGQTPEEKEAEERAEAAEIRKKMKEYPPTKPMRPRIADLLARYPEEDNLSEAYPPGTPEGLSGEDKLNRGPAAGRGTLEFPEDDAGDEDESGFFYLEKGDNNFRDSSPSNAFHPASYDNDPAKFAQRIMKHLDNKGQPLTFNVYNGDPFNVASQNAVLQVINGEIIEPEAFSDTEGEYSLERYHSEEGGYGEDLSGYNESKRRITKKQLQRLIKEEVLGALK